MKVKELIWVENGCYIGTLPGLVGYYGFGLGEVAEPEAKYNY